MTMTTWSIYLRPIDIGLPGTRGDPHQLPNASVMRTLPLGTHQLPLLLRIDSLPNPPQETVGVVVPLLPRKDIPLRLVGLGRAPTHDQEPSLRPPAPQGSVRTPRFPMPLGPYLPITRSSGTLRLPSMPHHSEMIPLLSTGPLRHILQRHPVHHHLSHLLPRILRQITTPPVPHSILMQIRIHSELRIHQQPPIHPISHAVLIQTQIHLRPRVHLRPPIPHSVLTQTQIHSLPRTLRCLIPLISHNVLTQAQILNLTRQPMYRLHHALQQCLIHHKLPQTPLAWRAWYPASTSSKKV